MIYFLLRKDRLSLLCGLGVLLLLVIGCSSTEENATSSDKIMVPDVPEWVNHAVFYQIYPQSFKDSDGDGIGDLKGIIQELDYLKKIGIDAIWVNPFYVSPFRDAGYDVADYYKVAPRYGTNEDAIALFDAVHQHQMKIIIDFVPGHTSIDHPWFKESSKPDTNKYTNWYIWTNATWFPGMENYKENFIQGYSNRDGNYMTNFFWHQPALNYGWGEPDSSQAWQLPVDHPDVLALRAEMKNIMRYWLDMGCDGFRVDMAGSLVKNDKNQKIRFFWQDVRKMLDEDYPDAFIISEWSFPKAAVNAGFHADFMHWFEGYNDLFQLEHSRNPFAHGHSFFDAEGKGNILRFLNIYQEQLKATSGKGYISLPIGNHDLIRIRNNGRTMDDMKVISAFNLTMPGVPFIYYGDEIGMKQLIGIQPKEGAYGTRSGARTPMQWNRSRNLGFSAGNPDSLYFPVDPARDAPVASEALNNPDGLLPTIEQLIALRHNEMALSGYAKFEPLYAVENQYPFIYARMFGQDTVIVGLNPANRITQGVINMSLDGNIKLLSGKLPAIEGKNIKMEPVSYFIVKKIH